MMMMIDGTVAKKRKKKKKVNNNDSYFPFARSSTYLLTIKRGKSWMKRRKR